MLSDELISKIAAGLDDLPKEPTSRRELMVLLSRLADKIRAAQARGASYVEIARQITASGYPIKPGTLRAGINRQRKSMPEAGRTRRPTRAKAGVEQTLRPK